MVEVDFVAISGLIGFGLPLVISFLKQQTWSSQVKKGFSFGVAVAAAVVATGVQEGWSGISWDNLIASAAVILPMAQTSYSGFWEDSSVEVRLAQSFDRTSI